MPSIVNSVWFFVSQEARCKVSLNIRSGFMLMYHSCHLVIEQCFFFFPENAFGHLVSVFRIFRSPMEQSLPTIDKIVLACCSLQNFMITHRGIKPPSDFVEGEAREKDADLRNGDQVFQLAPRTGGHLLPRALQNNKTKLMNWFMGEGAVPWQMESAISSKRRLDHWIESHTIMSPNYFLIATALVVMDVWLYSESVFGCTCTNRY